MSLQRNHERPSGIQLTGLDAAANYPDDAVLIVHLEDGLRLITSAGQYRADFPAGTRGAAAFLGRIEAFALNPQQETVLTLARKLEDRLERPPGLYRLTFCPDFQLSAEPAAPTAAGTPALIFIHGTASSTRGAFRGLTAGAALHAHYGDQVFAFEHRTLSEDPITNALALARALPAGAVVDLVSHSRGGLVGDLLSIGQLADVPPLAADLRQLLNDQKVRVHRFVRVASPSRGTTLASGRADRWFSMLLSLMSKLPFLDSDPVLGSLYEMFEDFVLGVAKLRLDPAVLPGIAAMMPGSDLIRWLNANPQPVDGELSVIAGVHEGFTRLAPDRFYGGPNDLVVNTASMDGGLRRINARIYTDQGSTVDHFRYFVNERSQSNLVAALTGGTALDFAPLVRTECPIPDRGGAPSRPAHEEAKPLSENRLRVSVTHGNLAFARYPVIAGHYEGDSIVGTEAQLDRLLDGRLNKRSQLGIYPGKIGESCIFTAPSISAILVGLGRIGDLRPSSLERTVRDAILTYAVDQPETELNLSSLLIGTALPLEASIQAIIRAVQAANLQLGSPARFTTLEFIDLWEDRAIEAAHCLARIPGIDAAARVDLRQGGLRRLVPANPSGGEWWNRLRISSENDALRFALITDRARTEVDLVPGDRGIADQFLRQAIGSTRTDARLASTLFELLVPNRLKEESLDVDRLVLMVDRQSARYPWELMNNLSVKAGMIRQLETEAFRQSITPCQDRTAFVVGNPVTTEYPDLPGAAQEAITVADALCAHQVVTTQQIRTGAMSIITDLHARCYRILHLAGHGVHGGESGGMVIGDGTLLTPAMIAQMRAVPELVFINCCHLGRTGDPHHLAANLAVEFIQMGVRAVIAAGWAVDDAAACTFAAQFYGQFLNGETFGESVRRARKATYDSHPDVNTWGAYQCYGDPEYRFTPADAAPGTAPQSFVLPVQAEVEIENLASAHPPDARARLASIVDAIPEAWRDRPGILQAQAKVHAELGDYAQAAEFYARFIAQARLEQINLRVRAAKTVEEIDRCIDELRNANSPVTLAGAYKRRAALTRDGQSLERMANAYRVAYESASASSYPDLWVNWQLAGIVLGRHTPDHSELARHLELARAKARQDPGFWTAVAIPDCLLLQCLAAQRYEDLPEIVRLYRAAVAAFASPREALTIDEHLTWLRRMLSPVDAVLKPTA